MKKILLLGGKSFLQPDSKVGLQFIAEGLARNNYEAHYISTSSSPFDILLKTRRKRFNFAWRERYDIFPSLIRKNLYEYILRTPFPVNKKFWCLPVQSALYNILLPKELKNKDFDLCIHDTSPVFLFSKSIKCKQRILRLSDIPEGFGFHVHNILIRELVKQISNGTYSEIWAVSEALNKYCIQHGSPSGILTISNGVDLNLFKQKLNVMRWPKTAVFIGTIERWVDLKLLDEVARILPDWQIDIYGLASICVNVTSPNLKYQGIVRHEELPGLLSRYSVGLIPFADNSKLIAVMERPLKFYEYLASGLGVASTDVGSLRKGMGEWARYGKTPDEFAQAIVLAAQDTDCRREEKLSFLSTFSWENIISQILMRIEQMNRQ